MSFYITTKFISTIRYVKNVVPKIVFVLGGPGSGKGTQCQHIEEEYGFFHIAAGDMLRGFHDRPGFEYKELIQRYIRHGQIVPADITCSLMERTMNDADTDSFLIDGFPRNKDNLDDCPLDLCTVRCIRRGMQGSGRIDDNSETLKKRLYTYLTETKPIIDYFSNANLLKRVDATHEPKDVFNEIKSIFKTFNIESK